MNSKNIINTEVNCIDFARSFVWYESQLVQNVQEALNGYWNIDLDLQLLAINNKPDILWHGTDYFVTQVPLVQDLICFARISKELVQILLNNAFGIREGESEHLQFNKITELEAEILTKFNDFIYKKLKQNFFKSNSSLTKIAYAQDWQNETYHFLILVKDKNDENSEPGKLILSISPQIIKNPEELPLPEEPYSFAAFESCPVQVGIDIGSTKVSLDDLKNIEKEDIIILDNSNIYKMRINEYDIGFNVDPDMSLVMDVGEEGGDTEVIEENVSQNNKWDDIQIDVNAEFKKVKLSLGELRQMSEGLIVDIAPVFKNEVVLQVDDSPVAKGELVIIGDRYGVRLTKVLREDIPEDANAADEELTAYDESNVEPALETEVTGDDSDDDFDYSDFEIDDEDI